MEGLSLGVVVRCVISVVVRTACGFLLDHSCKVEGHAVLGSVCRPTDVGAVCVFVLARMCVGTISVSVKLQFICM